MNGYFKKHKGFVISLFLFLATGGTVSVVEGPEYFVDFFRAPLEYRKMKDVEHDYYHHKEMSYEFGRLISDNWDSTVVYEIADDAGRAYDVDVRWVNGPNDSDKKIPIAFVGRPMYRPYTLYTADADGRWYINLHDNTSGETQNTYLHLKK